MYITRSEVNGTEEYYSLRDAQIAADCDPTIWRIYKKLADSEIFCLVRSSDGSWEQVNLSGFDAQEEIKRRKRG